MSAIIIAWSALKESVQKFNKALALLITKGVGSMTCAYLFAILALLGLPQALRPGGEGLVAWIAQTFLQLVLLSIILVGQQLQSVQAEQQAQDTHDMVKNELQLLKNLIKETNAQARKATRSKATPTSNAKNIRKATTNTTKRGSSPR